MKRIPLYSICFLSILSCNEKSETNNVAEERIKSETLSAQEAINNNNRQAEKWYKAKQIDSLLSIMDDNVIQMPPHTKPLVGKDSVRNYWAQLFQFGDLDFSIQAQDVKVNGPLAIELGKYGLSFTPNANSPIPAFVDSGNYLAYWHKIDDKWKIVWDAPVSTMPLPVVSK